MYTFNFPCGNFLPHRKIRYIYHLSKRNVCSINWGIVKGAPSLSCLFAPLTQSIKKKLNIMARIRRGTTPPPPSNDHRGPSSFGTSEFAGYDTSNGSSGPAEDGNTAEATDAIRDRIKRSYIYRKVYELFSHESDPYWLTELQGILDSVVSANSTWVDDLGLSNNAADKNDAVYNEAINNIMALYNEYRSYKNTLPINQVQQLSNAGINAAITGQGVTGSSLGELDLQSGAASMPSTNAGQYISDIANFALNATTGLTGILSTYADVAIKFKDLDLRNQDFWLRQRVQNFNEDKSFVDFKKLMSDSGVILSSTSWSELAKKDPNWADNASSRAKAMYNAYKEFMDSRSYGPALIYGVESGQYTDEHYGPTATADGVDNWYGTFGPNGYHGAVLSRDFAELGKMQVELAMAKAMHSAEVGNSLITEGLTPDDIAKAEAKEAKANANYNARKATIFLTRLEKLVDRSSKGDPVASVELINLMQSADWQESAAYLVGEIGTESMQLFGSSLEDIASWNADNFAKCIGYIRSLIK